MRQVLPIQITLADGSSAVSDKLGENGEFATLILAQFQVNFVSVRALCDEGAACTFGKERCIISMATGQTYEAIRRGRLFTMDGGVTQTTSFACSVDTKQERFHRASINEWNRILGHLNKNDVKRLEKINVDVKLTNPRVSAPHVRRQSSIVNRFQRRAQGQMEYFT